MARTRTTITETTVTHVAKPMGRGRDNGPHLKDLRDFVSECDGLPDDTKVFIDTGYLSESGHRDVTLRATQRVSRSLPEVEEA